MAYRQIHLRVGGVVAVGFNQTEDYLLVVSHSGRGVFAVDSWERVSRDTELIYPGNGVVGGIGPIAGESIMINELDSDHAICIASNDGRFELYCESSGINVTVLHE